MRRHKCGVVEFCNDIDADDFAVPAWLTSKLWDKKFQMFKAKAVDTFKTVVVTTLGIKVVKGYKDGDFGVWAEMENGEWSLCSGKISFPDLNERAV